MDIKPLHILSVLLGCMFLSSCCMNATCDCFDEGNAAISIRFKMDSTGVNGFTKGELKNCIMLGKRSANSSNIDTFTIRDLEYSNPGFVLWNAEALDVMDYSSSNSYHILNDTPHIDLVVSEIHIKGHNSGNCSNCQCYTNDDIHYTLNGQSFANR